ncbi:protein DDI1 2 isoform X1 [Biomphalaria glabrata]|uniref:UBA domain-containing protein n=1 Tax=Biomphalaria glabrata TaxID=6526 RepID=A0A2C9JY50_BIOGL|nr:protein DDI1 2 isoform X1 [Biomphalaria glabrata]
MQITITTLSDQLFTIDVSEDLELENFKALCQEETGVPAKEMSIVWNGRPLHDDKLTLKQYGIQNGEVVLVQHIRGQISHPSELPNIDFGSINLPGSGQYPSRGREDDPAFIRSMLLKDPSQIALLKERNPPLADALLSGDMVKFAKVFEEQRQSRIKEEQKRIQLLSADPFDPHAQQQIEEAIRMKNIETNMETAMEFAPESFGQVHMLYIDCKVNGHPVKAFVDSGAQMTIMSQQCAERCHIMRLVDRRWEGVAKGVGTQKILGRVHLCQIQIGNVFLQSSFSILENQPMDMLLGLDMLKRHQCVIDLKKNQLEIGTTGTITPFLGEADLPEHARLNQPGSSHNQDDDRDLAEALSKSAQESAGSSSSKTPSTRNQPSPSPHQFSEEVVSQLMKNGFSRNAVLEELRRSNGNADQALATLFSKSFNRSEKPPPPCKIQ